MKDKPIEELLTELMLTCGLGTIISPVKPVSGGFLHRMYRVVTNCGTYAVKYLNPEIMCISEVENTINRIKYIFGKEKDIKAALDSRLPKIETGRYRI